MEAILSTPIPIQSIAPGAVVLQKGRPGSNHSAAPKFEEGRFLLGE
jgi:hypothetical protein